MSETAIDHRMPEMPLPESDFAGRSLRLQTLIRLRWLAVTGQSIAVAVVYFGLGFPLPLPWCIGLIALSAALNLGLRITFPASHRLRAEPAFLLLSYDALQLAALLFVTGGLGNPFAILLLVPVIVSATTLAPLPTLRLNPLSTSIVRCPSWYRFSRPSASNTAPVSASSFIAKDIDRYDSRGLPRREEPRQ